MLHMHVTVQSSEEDTQCLRISLSTLLPGNVSLTEIPAYCLDCLARVLLESAAFLPAMPCTDTHNHSVFVFVFNLSVGYPNLGLWRK